MTLATITSKGQITIPKEVRDGLRLHTGDKVDFRLEEDGTARMVPKSLRPSEVSGLLASKIRAKKRLEEIDAAVAKAFREERR
jgi:AbrB family looped-hinge helix DNA binding protein